MFGIDDMAIAGGLSALANLGGGIMGAGSAAAANAAAQRRNDQQVEMFNRSNDLNQWYFAKNFENNLYMSNTAYQRATADMRAAGINPMLAYSQGGASTNAGGMQSAASQPHLGDPMPNNPGAELGRGLSRAVGSALDAYQTIQTVDNLRKQNEQIQANTDLQKAQQRREDAETVNKAAQTKLTEGQEKLLSDTQQKIIAETGSAYAQAGYYGAAARERDAQARRTSNQADKESTHGFGPAADLSHQSEVLSRRINEQLRTGGGGSPIEKTFPPFRGLRNNRVPIVN